MAEIEIDVEAEEAEARLQNWVPKEKFRGPEEDWVDAATFNRRGREIMPILRKNNENLLKELNAAKAQIVEVQQAAQEFRKFQVEAAEKKVKDLTTQLEQLKTVRAQAISDSDGARVNAIDDVIDGVKEEATAAKQQVVEAKKAPVEAPKSTVVDPILRAWIDERPWFGTDEVLTEYANAVGKKLRTSNPSLIGQPFLDKLSELLEEEGPAPLRKVKDKMPSVESGANRGSGGSGTSNNKRTYANLPDDAKKACDRYIKQGLIKGKTTDEARAKYCADYSWD